MMTEKTLTAIALSIFLSLSISAEAKTVGGDIDHIGKLDTEKGKRSLKKDEGITDATAALGQTLFFSNGGNFKDYFEKTLFSNKKKLHESINEVKPWKEGDEPPTVDQEKPNAEAIAVMFDEMTDKDAPTVVKGIWDAYKKIKDKPSSDSQSDEVVKRLWEAVQLKVPAALWPEKPPKQAAEAKDPRLASFREAFIEARDARLKHAEELKDKIKLAAGGNKAAQDALFGSKTDKENPDANKFAVGANINSYIKKMFADGNTSGAMEMIRALSVNGKMYLNNADGKAVAMDLPTIESKNAKQLTNIFNDTKMANAKFVGHEPEGELKPTPWIWDTVTKSVIPRGESKGTGGQVAANATDATAKAAGTDGAQAGGVNLAEVQSIVATNCANTCHSTEIRGNQIIGKGGRAGSASTNWAKMLTGLSKEKADAIKAFVGVL